MLFCREWSGVQGETKDLLLGEICGSRTAEGKRKQLCDNPRYCDGRIAEIKELVGSRNDNGPDNADNPSAQGVDWHFGVVCIGNCRAHFGVRTIISVSIEMAFVQVGVVKLSTGNLL